MWNSERKGLVARVELAERKLAEATTEMQTLRESVDWHRDHHAQFHAGLTPAALRELAEATLVSLDVSSRLRRAASALAKRNAQQAEVLLLSAQELDAHLHSVVTRAGEAYRS